MLADNEFRLLQHGSFNNIDESHPRRRPELRSSTMVGSAGRRGVRSLLLSVFVGSLLEAVLDDIIVYNISKIGGDSNLVDVVSSPS